MDLQPLGHKIQSYNPSANLERIRRAYDLAYRAHAGVMRSTGDPYIAHCVEVAGILADLYLDEDAIVAALLHDVPEDTHVSLETIQKEFGDKVAELVVGVTNWRSRKMTARGTSSQHHFHSKAEASFGWRVYARQRLALLLFY